MDKTTVNEKAPRLVLVETEGTPQAKEIATRLADHVARDFGPRDEKPLSIFAHDADGAVIGGLNGVSHWRWLYVRHLWTEPAWRGRGLGAALLAAAETAAGRRGCVGAYIDTFDPAVAAFYARRDYRECGRIAGFPPGAERIFLQKRLAD